uniref:Putative ovule protein n=1 Tax=Solanum chacoense TaxID=4108 RepID=A0A0V0GP29_SOLCH
MFQYLKFLLPKSIYLALTSSKHSIKLFYFIAFFLKVKHRIPYNAIIQHCYSVAQTISKTFKLFHPNTQNS